MVDAGQPADAALRQYVYPQHLADSPVSTQLESVMNEIGAARRAGYEIDERATWDAVTSGDYRIIMTRETHE